jgi:hypothetical protein
LDRIKYKSVDARCNESTARQEEVSVEEVVRHGFSVAFYC